MTLLALLFALLCERGLTHLMHLREWRWLDAYFDMADSALRTRRDWLVVVVAITLVALPVVPVALFSLWLGGRLIGVPQFALAVFVLLFAFGPRDLKDEVDDYVSALERGDQGEALRRGKELLESSLPATHGVAAREAIEDAIFIQANNRIFGVVFWFVVLGLRGLARSGSAT
jgi:membrane protein required for beta-lactamase induction